MSDAQHDPLDPGRESLELNKETLKDLDVAAADQADVRGGGGVLLSIATPSAGPDCLLKPASEMCALPSLPLKGGVSEYCLSRER